MASFVGARPSTWIGQNCARFVESRLVRASTMETLWSMDRQICAGFHNPRRIAHG
jgi:hypothetical protein